MRRVLIIVALAILGQGGVLAQNTVTTFILLRHAEKVLDDSDDPALLPAGEERAKKLISMFEKTKIDAIYSTKFKRTMSTVTPLGASKKIDVRVYEPFKEAPLDEKLKKHA